MSYFLIIKSIFSNWKLWSVVVLVGAAMWHYTRLTSELNTAKLQVHSLESKLADAAAQVETVKSNAKLSNKVVTKTEYYRLKGEDSIRYIDREIVKYDSTCVIPAEFIDELNKAATK